MATLELLIDASGMQRGAQQAEQALRGVQQASDRTATSVNNAGRSLSNAFQATGGSIQIAQGISQTAAALGSLNTAAGLFAASRSLLEVGKTADDFRSLRGQITTVTRDIYGMATATTRTAGVWSSLGSIIRAHPLLAIASVVSIAASAMSLFSSRSDQATESIKRQATELDKLLSLQRDREIGSRVAFGAVDPRTSAASTLDTLAALRSDGNAPIGIGQAARSFGVSESDFRQLLNQANGTTEFGEYDLRPTGLRRFPGQAPGYLVGQADPSRIEAAGRILLERRQYRGPGYASGAYPGPEIGLPQGTLDSSSMNYVEQSADDRRRVEEEHSERINENMRRAADYADQIGQSFGAAFADVILGASTLKQALAGLLQQGVRSGLSSAFGTVFSAAGRAFGATGTQQSQDFTAPGTNPPLQQ